MLDRQTLQNRAFFHAATLLLCTFVPGAAVLPATGAVQSASKAAPKPKAKVAEVLDLPTGHVGQRYETKILGVKGIDVGDASCTVEPELPAGLELNCAKMTISGHPEDPIEDAPVHITVSDSTGDSVTIDFNLTVIDGPDVVRIGGGRPAAAAPAMPVAVPAPRDAPGAKKGSSVARATPTAPAAPMPLPAPDPAPEVSVSREARRNPARVQPVAAVAPPSRVVTNPVAPIKTPESEALSSSSLGMDGVESHFEPLITSDVAVDSTVISGTAKASTAGAKVTVAIVSDDGFEDQADTDSNGLVDGCPGPVKVQQLSDRFLAVAQSSGTGATSMAPVDENGSFSVTLKSPLVEGQRFHVVQIQPEAGSYRCQTKVRVVKSPLDWGRIHADFAAGVLISNDSTNSTTGSGTAGSGNFSQAHQFYALSVEKSWSLPGCYIRVFNHSHTDQRDGKPVEHVADQCYDWKTHHLDDAHKWQHLWPGFNTYFQTRLTAIPVTTIASKNTKTTMDTTPTAAQVAGHPLATTPTTDTTTANDPTTNIISTAQTAKVEVGTYLPFFVTRWEYNNRPNALFIAPLGKVGFDTVTGPSTASTLAANGTIQTQTFEQVYNYWSYGARIGHMELSRTESKAPETFSYLDIAIGPYSSLQSYICKSGPAGSMATTVNSGSTCAVYSDLTNAVDRRKRLYRFDIEGLLKIPRTLFYVGLNANIGQKSLGAGHLDRGFAAPDDLRFFFGTKFDIASVLAKYNLGPH